MLRVKAAVPEQTGLPHGHILSTPTRPQPQPTCPTGQIAASKSNAAAAAPLPPPSRRPSAAASPSGCPPAFSLSPSGSSSGSGSMASMVACTTGSFRSTAASS